MQGVNEKSDDDGYVMDEETAAQYDINMDAEKAETNRCCACLSILHSPEHICAEPVHGIHLTCMTEWYQGQESQHIAV